MQIFLKNLQQQKQTIIEYPLDEQIILKSS